MNRSVVVALLLSLGVALGVTLVLTAPEPDAPRAIEWLDNARSLGRFSLESETGVFDNQSLIGHWTIVLFGFLHCPDVCPTSVSQLATLADSLAATPVAEGLAYVFVSVDPGRDSVTDVGRYVKHFDSSIRGVTGNPEQLTRFAGDLGIRFEVSADGGDYTVAHSSGYSVIGPQGELRGRFRPAFDVPTLVRSLTSIVDGHQPSRGAQ